MNKFILFAFFLIGAVSSANACTIETINTIVREINPYEEGSVSGQLEAAIDNLALCDENLAYAGRVIGHSFNPYQDYATQAMSQVIQARASSLPTDLVMGLGYGLIASINMYQHNSTVTMLDAILALGRAAPEYARNFALELLKEQNVYEEQTNRQLLLAVSYLRDMAKVQPPVGGSSIWAFRSQAESCDFVSGPWGRYEICPRYFASVSDQFGNRVVLACKSESFGIEFRVMMSDELWRQAQAVRIQTLAFGTSARMQSMGVPYVIPRDHALLAEEVLAPEILQQLRASTDLKISVRANSGETNLKLNFTLSGSNKAIGELLNVCR